MAFAVRMLVLPSRAEYAKPAAHAGPEYFARRGSLHNCPPRCPAPSIEVVPGLTTRKSRNLDFVRNPSYTADERAGRFTFPYLHYRIPSRLIHGHLRLLPYPHAVIPQISFRFRSLPGSGPSTSGSQ